MVMLYSLSRVSHIHIFLHGGFCLCLLQEKISYSQPGVCLMIPAGVSVVQGGVCCLNVNK